MTFEGDFDVAANRPAIRDDCSCAGIGYRRPRPCDNIVYVRWARMSRKRTGSRPLQRKIRRTWSGWLRHEIDYHSPAVWNDELILRTWVRAAAGHDSTATRKFCERAIEKCWRSALGLGADRSIDRPAKASAGAFMKDVFRRAGISSVTRPIPLLYFCYSCRLFAELKPGGTPCAFTSGFAFAPLSPSSHAAIRRPL